MKKKILISMLLVALAGFGFYLTKGNQIVPQKQEPLEKIKVAMPKDAEDTGFVLKYAQANGFFQKNGIEVEIVEAAQNPIQLDMTGAADVLLGGSSKPLSVYLSTGQTRVIANLFKPFSFYAVSRFPKEQLTSIKKVGVDTLGGEAQSAGNEALKSQKVDPATVEFIATVGNEIKKAMLLNGNIDMTISSSRPFLRSLLESGTQISVIDSRQIPGLANLMRIITTSQKNIDSKPIQIQKFVDAIYETLQSMNNPKNKDAVVQFAEKNMNLLPAESEDLYARFLDGQQNVNFIPTKENFNGSLEFAKKDVNMLNDDIDITNFIDDSFSRQATK